METPIRKTDNLKEYMKQYRALHPEKWKPVNFCHDCNLSYNSSITQHNRSNKHQLNSFMNRFHEMENKIKSIKSTLK
jgi:hypothetical protein